MTDKARHKRIEDAYKVIAQLVEWGFKETAYALRVEVDKLRTEWK